jgi:preprotein translocase subunit SecG
MDSALYTFVLVVHILLAFALVGVVLLQRSEGGALGIGGGPSGFMTARGASNLLTRATSVLTVLFVITSITLAGLAAGNSKASSDTEKRIQERAKEAAPATPAVPAEPQVPVAQ